VAGGAGESSTKKNEQIQKREKKRGMRLASVARREAKKRGTDTKTEKTDAGEQD
jgi:hypothetical protein